MPLPNSYQASLLPPVLERYADIGIREQIEAQAFMPVDQLMLKEVKVLVDLIKDRESGLTWNGFNVRKHADCKYFGIYQYGEDVPCTVENIEQLLLVDGVYNTCRQRLHQLTKLHNPDTFGWDAAAVGAKLGRAVALDDLAAEGNPGLGTFRGNNRYRWYRIVCAYMSIAHWSLGIRTGFLYGTQEYENMAEGEVLEAWGPEGATRVLGGMWNTARDMGKKLFLPISMQSFCAFTIDPGLNAPWVVQSQGRDRDSQRLAEKKRGRRRRAVRNMDRDGFVGKTAWMDLVGAKVQADKSNPEQGMARVTLRVWDEGKGTKLDDTAMPESTFLIRLFSHRGNRLVPLRDVLGRGDKSILVPSGDLLTAYVRAWAEPLATRSFLQAFGAAWEVYITYLERYMDVLEDYLGFTTTDLAKLKENAQALKTAKIGGTIAGAITTIGAALNAIPVVGTIVYVVLLVVAALVVLFTSLFGGAYAGCPKAPRPMMLRTFSGDNVCNVDTTGKRTLGDVITNQIAQAGAVGIVLADPTSGFRPPAGGPDIQEWPVFDDQLGSGAGLSPLVMGAGVAAVAGVALFAVFGGK